MTVPSIALALGLALSPAPAGVPQSPAAGIVAASSSDATPIPASHDTLTFDLTPEDSSRGESHGEANEVDFSDEDSWLRPPFGDHLITDVDEWRSHGNGWRGTSFRVDYNRVDRLRLGVGYQIQSEQPMLPRVGARIEYPFDRDVVLYGIQFEQPLLRPGRLALGVSMVRVTDHSDLQQVEDLENSLALLLARQDYRDYFEREGYGAYLSWRVPDFSTVSAHIRNDDYRSLPLIPGTRSWFYRDRELRDNPAIADGQAHTLILRLERLAHRTHRTRAGFYHWVDVERAGHGLGGDFEYTRLLGDFRSVIRLSPATSLSVRFVGGHTFDGTLTPQKVFAVGGVDGLRAHPFGTYRGDEMLLSQAEYTVGLWRIRSRIAEGGLHAIAFVDVGRAWSDPDHHWDVGSQRIETDGGFGLSTSEDNLRVYFAKNLREPDSDFVVSVRLQRPF
jgi:hypothetical protein